MKVWYVSCMGVRGFSVLLCRTGDFFPIGKVNKHVRRVALDDSTVIVSWCEISELQLVEFKREYPGLEEVVL